MKRNIKTFNEVMNSKLAELGSAIAVSLDETESKQDKLRAYIVEATKAKKGDEIGYDTWIGLTKRAAVGLMQDNDLAEYEARGSEPSRVVQMRSVVKRALKEDGITIGAPAKSTNKEAVKKQAQKSKAAEFAEANTAQLKETATANGVQLPEAALIMGAGKPASEQKKLTNLAFNLVDDELKAKQNQYADDLKLVKEAIKSLPTKLAQASQTQVEMLGELVKLIKGDEQPADDDGDDIPA